MTLVTHFKDPKVVTLVLMIGNTDNRLTQQEWAAYCNEFMQLVTREALEVHFCGGPSTWSTYQNLCMVGVFDLGEPDHSRFVRELQDLRVRFRQDSVAVVPGITQFI